MPLAQLFNSLSDPVADAELPSFSTAAIGSGPHRLGKDTVGAPALLVSLSRLPATGTVAPVELEHISVQHGVRCRLWRSGADPESGTLTLVRCRDTNRILREYFLGVIEAIVPLLGPAPSEARVREVVAALIELFRALELPPRKALQGLWGELYVITQATDAAVLVGAWHASPEDPYDFSGGTQRLEVKSASGDERRHHFKLVQLHPPAGTIGVIASLFVERAGGGVSLGELLERARARVSMRPDLSVRLDQIAAASLGNSWTNALTECFDWERAQESLAFFDATTIPSVRPGDVPVRVSDVRFRSDLTLVQPIFEGTLRERGGLLGAALPLRGPVL